MDVTVSTSDKKNGNRPVIENGQVAVRKDYDAERAGLHIMVDAFVQPKLDDPELMEFYKVNDRLDMPETLFANRDDFRYANKCVMEACGLAAKQDEEETVEKLIDRNRNEREAVTLLTAISDNPTGYGRIVRNEVGEVLEIVEESMADAETKKIKEINSGIYCFDIESLLDAVKELKAHENGQIFLTDVIKIMKSKDLKIGAMIVEDNTEILGVHDRVQLELLGRVLRMRINTMHMLNGVTIEDSDTTYIYEDVKIGRDTVIHPNTTIKSDCVIGEDCEIGPNAYIREKCVLADKVKIGNCVEIKKTKVAYGSKVPHLSYMGDCEIGTGVNIGCGSITCNYDGVNKHKTIIGDKCFVGSNTNLVAPVKLGDNVLVAAGSTITEDVPADSLAIARERQVVKEGWNKNK